ncbi:hypothetical protein Rhopal_004701-T1 [Rhodotorula paludigena]|uniref:Uncharacterized protein n=1 Tax=Rhodotorula paludigena TaxID=86838 RepID=A0AAV5GNB0_9BASI|nr:hypothetical protein Rhopal_004701-T1 [Rhodotorula paludigena]
MSWLSGDPTIDNVYQSPTVLQSLRRRGITEPAQQLDHQNRSDTFRHTEAIVVPQIHAFKLAPQKDGYMHRQSLNAHADDKHTVVNDIFKRPDGKPVKMTGDHDRKSGGLMYQDKRLMPVDSMNAGEPIVYSPSRATGLGALESMLSGGNSRRARRNSAASLAEELPQILEKMTGGGSSGRRNRRSSLIGLPVDLLSGAGGLGSTGGTPAPQVFKSIMPGALGGLSGLGGLGGTGDIGGPEDPADRELAARDAEFGHLAPPQTADELASLLGLRPVRQKILEITGDLDIKETYCTEFVELVKRSNPGDSRKPALVLVCNHGLPQPKSILKNPNWLVGPRSDGVQVLIFKFTRKVQIHVHFKLRVAIPAY